MQFAISVLFPLVLSGILAPVAPEDHPVMLESSKGKLTDFIIRQLEKWEQYHQDKRKQLIFTVEIYEGDPCRLEEDDDHCALQSVDVYKNIFNMWQCEAEKDTEGRNVTLCRCGFGIDEAGPRVWDKASKNCLIPKDQPCDYTSERQKFRGVCEPGFHCDHSRDPNAVSQDELGSIMVCVAGEDSNFKVYPLMIWILLSTQLLVYTLR